MAAGGLGGERARGPMRGQGPSATLMWVHGRRPVAAWLAPPAATACGSVTPPSAAPVVSKLDVARGASQQLSADLQEFPPTVSCPNDLPAQVGAVEDCALTDFTRHDRHLATVRIDRIGAAHPITSLPSAPQRSHHRGTDTPGARVSPSDPCAVTRVESEGELRDVSAGSPPTAEGQVAQAECGGDRPFHEPCEGEGAGGEGDGGGAGR